MTTIVVYRAKDGRYGYCPQKVRHWPINQYEGEFQTEQQAFAAALADPTIPKDAAIRMVGR